MRGWIRCGRGAQSPTGGSSAARAAGVALARSCAGSPCVRCGVVSRGVRRQGACLVEPRGHERELLRAVSALWDRAAEAGPADRPARVGVVVDALVDPELLQLFAPDAREHRLQELLDAVRDRYSAPALLWGRCADPRGRYTGAKIAYQSFPDERRLRWLGII